MTMLHPHQRTFVALDTTDVDHAEKLAESLKDHVGGMKVGKEFFTACGPAGVERIVACGMPVFLDLKFHDIPNTVAGAIRAAARLRPFMVNVHATGGGEMMRAALDAAREGGAAQGCAAPLVIAVTVLTSLNDEDLHRVGISDSAHDQVLRLADLAQLCGLDGVVCSAREASALKEQNGPDFKLVVPGIRPAWASGDDQKRIVTPARAVADGADYLVIGRPITGAENPVDAADKVCAEIAAGE